MLPTKTQQYTCLAIFCFINIVNSFICRSGTSLGKVSPPESTLDCVGALIEKCSVVYTNNAGNEIWMFSCASSSNKCGDRIKDVNTETINCCCDKEQCNDAAFAERCSSGITTISHISLVVAMSLLVINYLAG